MSVTFLILIATCVISVVAFQNPEIKSRFIFNPYIIHHRKQWYRFFTSGMIHADWIHLLINMFVLFSFGNYVEDAFEEIFGERATMNFLILYFGGMVVSVISTYRKNVNKRAYNALGASGAVSAVVFAYILFSPLQKLCLYGLLCLPGIIFGAAYLVYCYYAGKKGDSYINHEAHLWGALFGFLFPIILQPQLLMVFINQLPFVSASF
jgi:membrane associated rhomboid family serine protease